MLIILMVIGASPSGTGGGLKTTTVTALWAVASSVIRGKPRAEFLGRAIPANRVRAAVAAATFYGLMLGISVWLLAMTWPQECDPPLADQIFEVTSALGTVGLSRGITGNLTDWGKLLLVFVMFVGRIGPLGLAYSLTRRVGHNTAVLALAKREEDVVV
jgi:trk system potassium uptake protein TrkH